jgi:hypothetical protein
MVDYRSIAAATMTSALRESIITILGLIISIGLIVLAFYLL